MKEDPRFNQAWEEFKAMRKKKKRPLTESAEKRQYTKVQKLFNGLKNNMDHLIEHINEVTDRCYDNIYSDENHYNNIISKYGGRTIIANGSVSGSFAKTNGANFYNYQKDSAYFAAAEGLRDMCEGFNFVGAVASK